MSAADADSKTSDDAVETEDKKVDSDGGCTSDVPTLVQADQLAAQAPADPIEDGITKNDSPRKNVEEDIPADLHEKSIKQEESATTKQTSSSPSATATTDISVNGKKPTVIGDGKLYFYPPGGWGNRKRKSPEQLIFRDLLKEHAVAYYSLTDQDVDKRAFVKDRIMVHYPDGAYFADIKGVITRASDEDVFKVVSQKLRDVYNKIIRNPDPTSNKQKRKRSKKGLPYDSSSEEPQQSAGDVKVEGMANSSFGDSLRALKAQYETYIESLQEQVDRLRKINVTQEVKIEQLQKILMESQPPQEVKIPAKALKEVASDPTTSS